MEGRDDHQGNLDGQEDADDDDEHHGGAVGVPLPSRLTTVPCGQSTLSETRDEGF